MWGDISPYSVIGVATNSCWGPNKRAAEGADIKTPKASRGEEYGEGDTSPPQPTTGSGERRKLLHQGPGRSHGGKRVLEYIEFEKTHLIATNLSYFIFCGIYLVTFTFIIIVNI